MSVFGVLFCWAVFVYVVCMVVFVWRWLRCMLFDVCRLVGAACCVLFVVVVVR